MTSKKEKQPPLFDVRLLDIDSEIRSYLNKIVKEYPHNFYAVVKKQDELYQKLITFTPGVTKKPAEIIYSFLYPGDSICNRGNKKKFKNIADGYGYCGTSKTCACYKEIVNKKISDARSGQTILNSIANVDKNEPEMNIEEQKEILRTLIHDTTGGSYIRVLKRKHPHIFNNVFSLPPSKFAEKSYWFYMGLTKAPLCEYCKTENTRFKNVKSGYARFCSNKCETTRKAVWNQTSVYNQIIQQCIDPPKCTNESCNNDVIKLGNGLWSEYCSTSCRGQWNSLVSRNKAKETMKANHGVEHALQSPIIMKKMRDNIYDAYGVDHMMKLESTQQKQKNTLRIRYGVDNIFKLPAVRAKHCETLIRKYGVTNISQIPEVQRKKEEIATDSFTIKGKTYLVQGYERYFLEHFSNFMDVAEIDRSNSAIRYVMNGKTRYYFPDFEIPGLDRIIEIKSTYTFDSDLSKNIEKGLATATNFNAIDFLVYDKDVLVDIITINQQFLKMKEYLDNKGIVYEIAKKKNNKYYSFYIPARDFYIDIRDYSITYEQVVGKEHYKEKSFNINVLVMDNSVPFERYTFYVEYKFSQNTEKINARSCDIRQPSPTEVRELLEKYHLQGFSGASYHYGLYHDEKLVSVMSFSNSTSRSGISGGRSNTEYELVRFASICNVRGAASKLLAHFVNIHKPTLVYSYSNNKYSSGNLYATLGFTLVKDLPPDYLYIHDFDPSTAKHRIGFTKSRLVNLLGPKYDPNKTEKRMMMENGYQRIYDAGKKVWEKKY